MSRLFAVLCIALCVWSCGPREIGQGTSSESHVVPDATAADMLRFPITGMNHIQQKLYWQNRPEVMAVLQKNQVDWFRQRFGHPIDPESPDYRAIPRQRSPFRQ